jgi:hypothetical protein
MDWRINFMATCVAVMALMNTTTCLLKICESRPSPPSCCNQEPSEHTQRWLEIMDRRLEKLERAVFKVGSAPEANE